MKKVVIIWAWPWGLSSAMILASRWYDVEIYEKNSEVWWRNNFVQLWDYKFDLWPTFLMYLKALEDVFKLSNEDLFKYLDITQLDPLYRLSFWVNDDFFPRAKIEDTKWEIAKKYPNDLKNFDKYITKEWKKLNAMLPCLEVPYLKITSFFTKRFLKAFFRLDLLKTLYQRLDSYFLNENLKIAMTFQAKYLWMSPWKCPASFTILSYLEHKMWIFHVKWWLNKISKVMSEIIQKKGWKIHLNSLVKEIIIENNEAKWIILDSWEKIFWDYVIINSDFAYSMKNLIKNEHRKKYTDKNLEKKDFSCSTFMIYLWLDKVYENLNHHNVIFNSDYKTYVDKIVNFQDFGEEFSFYVHNPSLIDETLAPKWHSSLYILIPTPNNKSNIDWEEKKDVIENKIFDVLSQRFWINDIRNHIKQKLIITPNDWENKYNIHLWAVFNLSHSLNQMLYFRPHNEFEDVKNIYLVWWWTHPWSWLPTIYESWRISAELIIKNNFWKY